MNIAYIILAHKNMEQVHKLVNSLHHANDHFFIHVDRKYGEIPEYPKGIQNNLHWVEPRLKVYWGGFNIVQATLNALRQAREYPVKFDYYVLLSGQCFSIKHKSYIREFFQNNPGKLFMEANPVDENSASSEASKFDYPVFFDQLGFLPDRLPGLHRIEYKKLLFRYIKYIYKFSGLKRKPPAGLTPYAGSQWWALPNKATEYVLNYTQGHPNVLNYFKYTWAPDELFFQTILGNSPLAKDITNSSLWYIDWKNTESNGSPKTLKMEDYSKLCKSSALFARKFDNKTSSLIISNLPLYQQL